MEAERTFEIQVEYWKKNINSNSWPELFFYLSLTHTYKIKLKLDYGPSSIQFKTAWVSIITERFVQERSEINQNRDMFKRCLR